MLTYQTLDAIADAVTPLLLGTTLLLPAIPAFRARTGLARWYLRLAATLFLVYGLMLIDGQLRLWPAFGADYSTHTALALALVGLWHTTGKRMLAVGLAIFVAYIALMLYQRYHTPLDIVTTAGVIGLLLFGMLRATDKNAGR
jgi:hypothetical protein